MGGCEDLDNIIPAEKITFIAYYFGVYESIQKFGGLFTNAVRILISIRKSNHSSKQNRKYDQG
jgi:hypothetical protein